MKFTYLLTLITIVFGTTMMFSYFFYETVDRRYLIESQEYGGEGLPSGSQGFMFFLEIGDVIEFGRLVGPADVLLTVKGPYGPWWETEIVLNAIADSSSFKFAAPNDGIYKLIVSNNYDTTQGEFHVLRIMYRKNVLPLYAGVIWIVVGLIIAALEFLKTRRARIAKSGADDHPPLFCRP